jgi:hypothetical protein
MRRVRVHLTDINKHHYSSVYRLILTQSYTFLRSKTIKDAVMVVDLDFIQFSTDSEIGIHILLNSATHDLYILYRRIYVGLAVTCFRKS